MIREKWMARVLVFMSAVSMCAPVTALAEEVPAEEITAAEVSDEDENGGDSATGYSSEEMQTEPAAQDNSEAVAATGAETEATEATEATETSSDAVTGSEDEIEGAAIAEYNAGWSYSGGKWYYYSGSGKALTGWQYLSWSGGRSWFYFDGNGAMRTGWQYLSWSGGRNWFFFDGNGAMRTGWQYLSWSGGRNWFYFDGNGAMKTGWQYLSWGGGRNWFYFDGNGAMKSGWQYLSWSGGRSWFYFDGNGAMKTGWQYLSWSGGKNWFYFDTSSGAMKTGWLTVNGKTYYLNSSGAMLTGTQTIDGTRYTFGSDGALISGAVRVELNNRTTGGKVYAVLTGYSKDGSALWTKETGRYEGTQLKRIGEIGIYNGLYYYYEDGSVITLNLQNGNEVWRNTNFGGASASWVFDTDGTLYISGWEGPMLMAIDTGGKTLHKLNSVKGYMWPEELKVQGDVIKVDVTTENSAMRKTTIYIRKSDFSVQTK